MVVVDKGNEGRSENEYAVPEDFIQCPYGTRPTSSPLTQAGEPFIVARWIAVFPVLSVAVKAQQFTHTGHPTGCHLSMCLLRANVVKILSLAVDGNSIRSVWR